MKRILMAAALALAAGSQVMAADLPPAPPPPPRAPAAYVPVVLPVYNWTGFYIGGNIGYQWASQGSISDSQNPGVDFNVGRASNGSFLGGGQIGANYQINAVVLGVEGDFEWAANHNNNGNGVVLPITGQTIQVTSNNRWLTTLTGRFGFAADRVLFYIKGGGAWVGNSNFTVTNATTGFAVATSSGSTNTGWTAGAGVEWAFAENWTTKLEYNYVGLSSTTYTVPSTSILLPGDVFTTGSRNIQTITAGINFIFH
jgi:outer membrane immunogenic protein